MPFEALRERLLKAGIAPRHVRRYLRELDDHLEDLTAAHGGDSAQALAQLGDEDQLAAAMLARPELKSWAARAPWLVFGLAPPLTLALVFVIVMLPLVLLVRQYGHGAAGSWIEGLAHGVALSADLVLGPLLAALLVWAGLRQRISRAWPFCAVALIALAGIHTFAHFPAPGQSGQIGIGVVPFWQLFAMAHLMAHLHGSQVSVKIGAPELGWPFLIAQLLLTLAPSLWLLRRAHSPGA